MVKDSWPSTMSYREGARAAAVVKQQQQQQQQQQVVRSYGVDMEHAKTAAGLSSDQPEHDWSYKR
jgi:hypothetical protein